ncbi:TonB-dependent receptor [Leeuwenhoekiella marinoflava]|uniref:SusC/RagA family TonB-linked outer membrane protein n=1 Tax=Leeuwenhoekiella marinoflava TaxID=988 RepID=UPI0030022133|tara:strand:+ start:18227 stop:21412 length:3186 start_codon:yes stop_codon:yes gene_type:complete
MQEKLFKRKDGIYRKGKMLTFAFLCLLSQVGWAQQIVVKGTVTDQNGTPLLGVNVIQKSTSNGTATDFDGNYQITAPQDGVLVFSFVGFETQEVKIEDRQTINVNMSEDSESLEEVVLIGYGTQQRQDVNGSVSSIEADEIENIPQVSIDQLMQGRAAGVTVSQNSGKPGSAVSVRIRGITSITGNNEPLYVIDGVPISGDSRNTSTSGRTAASDFGGSGQTGTSPLAGLNPSDIESVDILKDASATAIYGSRGANGVVIIKTKNGSRNKEGSFKYNTYYALQEPQKLLDVMNLQTYARLQNALAVEYDTEPRVEFTTIENLGEGTDWQDEVFQQAILKSHQVSYSQGNEKINYLISGSYLDQEGTVIGSGFERMTVRTNVDGKLKDWLKVGSNLTASRTDERITLNSNRNGIVSLGLLQAPDVAVRNPDGTFAGPPDEPGAVEGSINPVALALERSNNLITYNVLGNFYSEFTLLEGLTFRNEIGGNLTFGTNSQFTPTYKWGRFVNENATLFEKREKSYFWIVKNYFNYSKTFNEIHNVSFLLGQEAQESSWEGIQAQGQGFVNNDIQTLNNANSIVSYDAYQGSTSLSSYFGRANYSYNNKYSITATLRADGSSKFDPQGDKQWGYFPSFAGSWKVSSEPWMEGVNETIDNIRFKAGYGVVGNQGIPNYLYGSSLNNTPTGIGLGYLVNNIPNPDLKWEETRQTNLGLEFTLLDNRFNATIEVYNKNSKDFLYQLPLPVYLTGPDNYLGGISAPYVNLGEMNNKGIDVTLGYTTLKTKDFTWSTNINISYYKNEVTSLYNESLEVLRSVTTGFLSSPITRTVEGEPIGQYWGYKVKGIFRTEEDLDGAPLQFGIPFSDEQGDNSLGDIQYVDVNNDGVIDERDRTYIGNPHPDFTFGFTNSFSYKNFDLSVFLQGSVGNDLLNLTRKETVGLARLYTNQLDVAQDFYTPDNIESAFPRPRRGDDNQNLFISDRYVEDGSYLRIQNISLGYNIPKDISEKFYLSNLKIYGTIQNLYTFTNYSGYDPEVGSFNGDALQMGVDRGRYPSPRTFTLGLNVEF